MTVGLFRKYMSFLDLPLSWLMPSSLCCCVGLHGYRLAKVSISLHQSSHKKAASHLCFFLKENSLVSGGHVLPSHSASLVSLPLHHLLSVHVCKYIPKHPTSTKEYENVLELLNITWKSCLLSILIFILVLYLKVALQHLWSHSNDLCKR